MLQFDRGRRYQRPFRRQPARARASAHKEQRDAAALDELTPRRVEGPRRQRRDDRATVPIEDAVRAGSDEDRLRRRADEALEDERTVLRHAQKGVESADIARHLKLTERLQKDRVMRTKFDKAVEEGHVPAAADPLLHNESAYPLQSDVLDVEAFERVKALAGRGNQALSDELGPLAE